MKRGERWRTRDEKNVIFCPVKKPVIKNWVLSPPPPAVKRMEERKISLAELQTVLSQPDLIIPQGPKWIFAKRLLPRRDNLIAAVLLQKKEKDLWLVISVLIRFEKRF